MSLGADYGRNVLARPWTYLDHGGFFLENEGVSVFVALARASAERAIMELRRGIAHFQGRVVLLGMTPVFQECFKLSGLLELFGVAATLEEALQA